MAQYEFILTETPAPGVGVVRLNRPQSLNALSKGVISEVVEALRAFNDDPEIGCLILTGSDRAFAAGADIKEMSGTSAVDMYMKSSLIDGFDFSSLTKP